MRKGDKVESYFHKYFAYGSILEALSFGLYPDKKHVIREFIQNAFDAVNEFKEITDSHNQYSINIKIEPPSIFIYDNGIGMNEIDIEKYRRLGYSDKHKNKSVGFRGIGKDSGLSVADKIIITSSKIGDSNKYTVEIDAHGMLDKIENNRNTPLETLLRDFSSMNSEKEKESNHYTLVELHNIRQDAKQLFEIDSITDYIMKNCPVPFNPQFTHFSEIEQNLIKYVPGYSCVNIFLDDVPIYKAFPQNYGNLKDIPIFINDSDDSPLLAYCWYCPNTGGGQYEEKDKSGLIYRVRNFAVGERFLTRKTLWQTSPERAFYYFGEIHIIDSNIRPSTDRTNFEDNDALSALYQRCKRIAQILNSTALAESDRKRFAVKLRSTANLLVTKEQLLGDKGFSTNLKEDIQFQVRKAVEDLNLRLKRTKGRQKKTKTDSTLIKSASKVIIRGNKLLRILSEDNSYYRIIDLLHMNAQAQFVYETIIECLKEKFKHDPPVLEDLIELIDNRLLEKHKNNNG